MSDDPMLKGTTYEKGSELALRAHFIGAKAIKKGQGLHPGGNAGTPNHDLFGLDVYACGSPSDGIPALIAFVLAWWERGFFTSHQRDEWASRSHDFLTLTALLFAVLIGVKQGSQRLVDECFRALRAYLKACSQHMGRPGGGRYPYIDMAYARDAAEAVGQARTREIIVARLMSGTPPHLDLDDLDATALWVIDMIPPGVLFDGLQGWKSSELPPTRARYHVARWPNGHQGWVDGGDTGAALSPAGWLRREGSIVTVGLPPHASKYTTVPPSTWPAMPAVPANATVVNYPLATCTKEDAA